LPPARRRQPQRRAGRDGADPARRAGQRAQRRLAVRHADVFAPFTSAGGARFLDNVGAWMAVEPAIDFTAGMPYALGRLMEQGA
jgi:hypothetical protein